MNIYTKDGQRVIAGRVGSIERKTDTLVVVSIANRKNKEETEWVKVAFTDPQGEGQKLADLAERYLEVGQYVTVLANEREHDEYKTLLPLSLTRDPSSLSKREIEAGIH